MQQPKSSSPNKRTGNTKSTGVVRIIGGEMRGRKLHFSIVNGLRPTLDRVRETLFNWLSHDIYDATCLDLFAGSGALGFEAISRGAKDVTFVEKSDKVVRDLKKNKTLLKQDNIQIYSMSFSQFLKINNKAYDVVFLDPPFREGLLTELLDDLIPHLAPAAQVYIEQETSANPFVPDEKWINIKHKKTSSLIYSLYQLSEF